MTTLSERHSNTVRRTNQVLNEELLSPGSLAIPPDFTDFDTMKDFEFAARVQLDISRTVTETREAVRQAGATLAAAHAAAAAITVTKLTDAEIGDFTAKLNALNDDIRNNQTFSRALQVSEAIVATLEGV